MIIQFPGKVNDRIKILGTPFIPIYLIKGESYALIEGGIKVLYPLVKKQLEAHRVSPDEISNLILLHSHIDHTGIAFPFNKYFPKTKICTSEETAGAILKEKISPLIKKMEEATERFLEININESHTELDSVPNIAKTDKILKDGDEIQLGNGITIQFLSTPGHSSCSMSAYIPEQKALFISDSAGLPISSKMIFPMIFGNFSQFVSTCEKLSNIDADIICFGHFLALTGKDAKGIFPKIRDEAIRMKEIILEKYTEYKDIGTVIDSMEKIYNKGYVKQLSYVFYEGSARAIIKILLKESGIS